ncbi:MAG: hypothetical protein JRN20_01905 [Nitrososphaerota archaeon]|jgi:hypothetical protein|nr:hypothetical protein [Nitrososphaerota archaeon]MDG6922849.1 hypothetical protein [Nitrososphaerota archaeon]
MFGCDGENTLHNSIQALISVSSVFVPSTSPLDIYSFISTDLSLISSIAVILGALFVAYQIRENGKLIKATEKQAESAAIQAKLTTEQMKQNNEIANMDMIMRLYEFANTAEVQSAWLTVLSSKVRTFEEFELLSRSDQICYYQIAALFESLGVLAERNIVKLDIIEDMFLTELAWTTMKPFVLGMRKKFGEDQNYAFFERLHSRLKNILNEHETPISGTDGLLRST